MLKPYAVFLNAHGECVYEREVSIQLQVMKEKFPLEAQETDFIEDKICSDIYNEIYYEFEMDGEPIEMYYIEYRETAE